MLDEPIVVKLRFLTGVPLFDALVRGQSPHPAAPNYLTRNSRLSYGENRVSLSDLGLIRYRVVTPGRTDGQTEFPQLIRALSSTCRYSCRA